MKNPKASIVILTLGDAESVVADLKKQNFQDFEIVFAREKGIVNAMNRALERCRGEIMVRVDDDVALSETWLESLLLPFKDPSVAGSTGPTFIPRDYRESRDSIRYAENPGWFLKWLYDNGEFKPGGIRKCGCVSYDSNFKERFRGMDKLVWSRPDYLEGTNWAMRTSLIRQVGGFDPKFDGVAEWFDTDVEAKIKKLGYSLAYNPKAYLYHLPGKGPAYDERFQGFGRIKNFLRYHWRHGRHRFLNVKFYIYLLVWTGYFILRRFKK